MHWCVACNGALLNANAPRYDKQAACCGTIDRAQDPKTAAEKAGHLNPQQAEQKLTHTSQKAN
jgi:hypothetical protein